MPWSIAKYFIFHVNKCLENLMYYLQLTMSPWSVTFQDYVSSLIRKKCGILHILVTWDPNLIGQAIWDFFFFVLKSAATWVLPSMCLTFVLLLMLPFLLGDFKITQHILKSDIVWVNAKCCFQMIMPFKPLSFDGLNSIKPSLALCEKVKSHLPLTLLNLGLSPECWAEIYWSPLLKQHI